MPVTGTLTNDEYTRPPGRDSYDLIFFYERMGIVMESLCFFL
jgi:hypothetical protein